MMLAGFEAVTISRQVGGLAAHNDVASAGGKRGTLAQRLTPELTG
ncbi:hypothetical protein [Novipirellula artificiosorum]|nr:hypothetical protein [Novipirellula artificiosorum]